MSDPPTPLRFAAPCEFCGLILDIRQIGVHQFVSGWVLNREGGGGHGVSLPKREPRWAHRHCVDRESKGHTNQQDMF